MVKLGRQKMNIEICKDCYERMRNEIEMEGKNIEFSTFDGWECTLCGKMEFFSPIDEWIHVPVILHEEQL
mgnify:CR=1 FL=1